MLKTLGLLLGMFLDSQASSELLQKGGAEAWMSSDLAWPRDSPTVLRQSQQVCAMPLRLFSGRKEGRAHKTHSMEEERAIQKLSVFCPVRDLMK